MPGRDLPVRWDVLWPPTCPADLDEDCTVGVNDFLLLLANWTGGWGQSLNSE